MTTQAKLVGYVAGSLAQQLANAQNTAERNEILKDAVNSEKAAQLQNRANADRVHEKTESASENTVVLDRVHISPTAQELYRARETELANAPERVHEHAQNPGPKPDPDPEAGILGPMDPEA